MILAAVAIFAFGLIAVVHEATRDAIAASKRARLLAKFDEVLAGERYDNDLLADRIDARDGDLLGTVGTGAGVPGAPARRDDRHRDRSGRAAGLFRPDSPAGRHPAGRPSARRARSEHRETPGLGDAIEVRKSNWILAFTGRSLQDPAGHAGRCARMAATSTSSPAQRSHHARSSGPSRMRSSISSATATRCWTAAGTINP